MAIGRKKTGGTGSRGRAKKPAEAPTPSESEAQEPETVEPEALEPLLEELEEVDAELEEATPSARAPSSALVRAGDAAVTRTDPLQAYMNEVHRHPLLKREEEVSLARSFRDTGNVQAAYRLVASNLRLVVKLAHEYHRNPLSLLDLVQEGNIGLMQAVKKYDPERGVKLSSYAAWWIRAYILRYIMDNWKMVKLGTTEAQRKLFFKLRQEQEKLVAQGFEVTPKMLADRLNVTEQDVVEMDQRLGHDEVSLDAPVGGDDSTATRGDRLLPSSSSMGAEERLGNEELRVLFREKLQEFAKSLEGKERYIFDHRLISDEPLTLQDIGDKYGVSRERARQIEAALINRMREYMREHIPDFDLVAVPKG
ncbi:sigma-70 family RNA polymerase sigma factor [Archangium primigenium]|uniref:sigma-70 family RNA polymerase sigma factor n=1 Tax=[Archangium] primigenium TaxID=2792470 RepID=UPI00195D04A2|nr:RNA polymerase factor sigma-32 [Archangium primigenium]MBM7114035.1 RNA polymerase factor sigma-32 [Archangium primigenium]